MTDIYHISKLIIKKKLKILTESDRSSLNKFNKKHPFTKEIRIEDLVDKTEFYSSINKEKAWESIEIKSQKVKVKPVISLFNKSWYKYAAVFVGILATAYFFKEHLFNLDVETTPNIVNTTTIEPGTNKATLTLEDGSVITLKKGDSLQTQNVKSNGEEIIYKANESNTKDIAYNLLTIPRGGQFYVELSDGTKVWLNSDSKLKYPVHFIKGNKRQVELVYGEAYFDVTPSSKNKGEEFIVLNKSQEVQVLGTEFNIKAYKNELITYTTLVEGKVAVKHENGKQRLLPNQQMSLDAETKNISIQDVDVYNEISWKDGVFSFERKSLKEIMKVLSRWYDVDVVFENKSLEDVRFFGVLGKDQEIEEILEIIKEFKIIEEYEIKDKTIILK